MTLSPLPSRNGQEFTIEHGDWRAVVAEQGAGLRELTWRGEHVTVPYGADEAPTCMAGQILVPFPNRIAAGVYEFEDVRYELPIDEHERNNAIHGYGYRQYWTLDRLSASSVALHWRVPLMKGYPFDVLVRAEYALDDDGLRMLVEAENHGDVDAPWAMAIHPWIANGGEASGDAIDALNARCTLEMPARTHVVVDENLIPVGSEPVEGTPYDYRAAAPLSHQPIDDAWTDLEHEDDGSVAAVFTRLDGLRVRVAGDRTITSFQVCDASGFPEAEHPCGVAIEPQTAYANAFNTGVDLVSIAPGESHATRLSIGVLD